MEDVGQALRQDSAAEGVNHLLNSRPDSGSLVGAFSDQIAVFFDNTLDSAEDVISRGVEDFLAQVERAENSLAHVLDDPKTIDSEFLAHAGNVIAISEHHNFHYSVKNTEKEVDSATLSGDKVDDNVVTDIGRHKIAKLDPGTKDKKNAISLSRQLLFQSEQERMLAEIEALIEETRQRIEELNHEIAELQEAEKALEEGDLNENTQAGAARRRRVETSLSKIGKSLEDFRKTDGTLDQDGIRQALEEERLLRELEREQRQRELNDLEIEAKGLREQQVDPESASPEQLAELRADPSNDALRAATFEKEDVLNTFNLEEGDESKLLERFTQDNTSSVSSTPDASFADNDMSSGLGGFESFAFRDDVDQNMNEPEASFADNDMNSGFGEFESVTFEDEAGQNVSEPVVQYAETHSVYNTFADGDGFGDNPYADLKGISHDFTAASFAQEESTAPTIENTETAEQNYVAATRPLPGTSLG